MHVRADARDFVGRTLDVVDDDDGPGAQDFPDDAPRLDSLVIGRAGFAALRVPEKPIFLKSIRPSSD